MCIRDRPEAFGIRGKEEVDGMSLLTGPMRKHLDGHKELTSHTELVKVEAGSLVYIPLINGNSTAVEVLVKEGDRVKVGTIIAKRNDHFTVPYFSSVSGTVKGIQKMMHGGLRPVDHLVIENDGKNETEQPFGTLNYQTATQEELVSFMMNAGIVGCGGAGFPSYVKYRGCKGIDLLIINAVECEPYITADYKNTSLNMQDLVTGVAAMLKMSGAKEAAIAIKTTKKDFIPTVDVYKRQHHKRRSTKTSA